MTNSRSDSDPVRYAVVGLGWFAQEAVLPAFANVESNSRLAALVSDDDEKRRELGQKYGVEAYSYSEYDELMASGTVDAVYIVLPNSLHHDYTLRAAHHGVHVLCEKPLAGTVAEAREMIDACERADVRLMTAYRLHFQDANLSVVELLKERTIGTPRCLHATHTNNVKAGNTRLDADLAGGPLRDIGIYCINAARYLFQSEPTEAIALSAADPSDARFAEVPEMIVAALRFPGERLATFTCGFGESSVSEYQVIGTEGDVRLEQGFSFNSDMTRVVTRGGKARSKKFRVGDQVGPEIACFSDCVREGREPEPLGVEGLIDLEIIEGIEESVRSGGVVPLNLSSRRRRPEAEQQTERPKQAKPDLVNAESPK